MALSLNVTVSGEIELPGSTCRSSGQHPYLGVDPVFEGVDHGVPQKPVRGQVITRRHDYVLRAGPAQLCHQT